ncbi:MAG: hypothetical protein R3E76_09855 [Planctomycetota bacterium]
MAVAFAWRYLFVLRDERSGYCMPAMLAAQSVDTAVWVIGHGDQYCFLRAYEQASACTRSH